MITSEQIRAARALLRITVAELANESGVGVATIKRLEATNGIPSANTRTLSAIKAALESLGIGFIGAPDDSPGVRLTGITSND